MSNQGGPQRALSPVIGAVLMVAIVVVLATVGGSMILAMTDETDPQPNVVLEGVATEDPTHKLVHGGGEILDGDRLELKGAATPDAPAGTTLRADDEITFYPTEREVSVIWYGDNGESYRLTTLTVDQTVPEPDKGCDSVENRTNGGTDDITVEEEVVNCDVETDKVIEIRTDGVVIGDVTSNTKELDADNAEVYGDVTVEKVLNVQTGRITGSATSSTEDVKVADGDVGGPIEAEKVAEVTNGTTVGGDVQSHTADSKVLDSSVVEGSVTADDTVKVHDSTVEGHVYASDFDCSNAEINGQDCSAYTPRDPSNW